METEITFDCEQLLEKFEFLKKDRGFLRQKITRAILQPLKTKTRRNVKKIFQKVTGKTSKNTDIWAFKDGMGRFFIGTFYGRLMESEHTIKPKHKEFLRFKIGDKWFTKKDSVFVKKYDVAESIWNAGTADSVMAETANRVMKIEFEKWSKK